MNSVIGAGLKKKKKKRLKHPNTERGRDPNLA